MVNSFETNVFVKSKIENKVQCINKLKLGVGKYSLGFEINQINIKSIGNTEQYESNAFTAETFNKEKISLGVIQQHEKGGKFCSLLYEDKKLRVKLSNIVEHGSVDCRFHHQARGEHERRVGRDGPRGAEGGR